MATSIHLLLFFLITTVSFLTSAAYPPSQTPQDHYTPTESSRR
uniref:Uncharacterized protein n=1 Tax=Brassica campestris TaxID=3711 RepID=A0A3P5YRX1_BRACM|nr:unnamed protein product [Brassica rapa]